MNTRFSQSLTSTSALLAEAAELNQRIGNYEGAEAAYSGLGFAQTIQGYANQISFARDSWAPAALRNESRRSLFIDAATVLVPGGVGVAARGVQTLRTMARLTRFESATAMARSLSLNRVVTPWKRNVIQRSDINWQYIRPDGLTNAQAAARGYTPLRLNPTTGKIDDVVLHHLNDDPRGAVVEVWRSTHTRYHNSISREPNRWRLGRPDWARAWNNEQSAYWRWRAGAYDPPPTDRLRLPGDR